jgi:hypothetical protein
MPEKNPNLVSFTVDVVGERTKDRKVGKFTVKKRLSFRDQLNRDNLRRELLGPAAGQPSPRAISASNIFSELGVRIVEAPSWWTDNNSGMDLEDDKVVGEVYDRTMDIEEEDKKASEKDGEKATEDLKAAVESDK